MTDMFKLPYGIAALAAGCFALLGGPSSAADVITMVVPFAPGGPGDQVARVVATDLGTALNKTVIVDNRGGAGSVIGTAYAAKLPPDGRSMLITTSAYVINAGIRSKLPFNPRTDLVPLYMLGEVQTMLVARSGLGAASLLDLVAKAKGGQLNYGASGVGGTMHIGAELFARSAKVPITHIPYSGAAPATTALLGGVVDLLSGDVPGLRPYVLDGRITGLAIFDKKRSPLLPDVPTSAEAGMPELQLTNWYGVFVPKGTPPDVMKQQADAFAKVVKQPALAARLAEMGFSNPESTAAFTARVNADFERWLPWLAATDIRID
jgi:tripartite-type tricarboxylate transporter receptor subunit TctC